MAWARCSAHVLGDLGSRQVGTLIVFVTVVEWKRNLCVYSFRKLKDQGTGDEVTSGHVYQCLMGV